MKKILALLALVMLLALTACGKTDSATPTDENGTESTGETTQETTVETAPQLPFDELFNGGNALALTDKNTDGVTANRILNRSSYEIFHAYVYENFSTTESKEWEYKQGKTTYNMKQYAVPEDVVYQYAAQFFNIDEETKATLKASDRYDSAKGIYWVCGPDLWFQGYDAVIKGYESLGSDEYILYAQAVETDHPGAPHSECATTEACIVSQPCFKAKIKATGKSSYIILSFEYIDSIPDNITAN